MKNKINNNLNVNINELLTKKYPTWMITNPEIYQLNEDLIPIKEWKNKKEIASWFNKQIQGVDLALRECVRFQGYYWTIKILYDKEGLRPLITDKRNEPIYCYNPSEDILKRYYNYEDFDHDYFRKDGIKEQFQFIGRFRNSVIASKFLDISVTNIRRTAKKEKGIIFHKDYYFSFEPLLEIHQIEADIIDLSKKSLTIDLKDEEKIKLLNSIDKFKKQYTEKGRYVGNIERQLYKTIMNSEK